MGEVLRPIILESIALSVFGISLVILGETNNASGQTKKGYLWAFIAVLCQALGIILSRSALQSNNIEALPSAMIRILFGIIPLLFILPFQKQTITKFNFPKKKNFTYFLLAVVFGTYLTLWLQQIAVIHINAGIAQTLLSTSPIFAAVIKIIQGKKTRFQTIIGILLTVIGVSMLF